MDTEKANDTLYYISALLIAFIIAGAAIYIESTNKIKIVNESIILNCTSELTICKNIESYQNNYWPNPASNCSTNIVPWGTEWSVIPETIFRFTNITLNEYDRAKYVHLKNSCTENNLVTLKQKSKVWTVINQSRYLTNTFNASWIMPNGSRIRFNQLN